MAKLSARIRGELPVPASEEISARAYLRARGKCECTLEACGHHGRCNAELQPGRWRGYIVSELVPDLLDRCQAMCQPCFEHAIRRQSIA